MKKASLIFPIVLLVTMTAMMVWLCLPTWKSKLEDEISGADRMVIEAGGGDPVEITGADNVNVFLTLLDGKEEDNPPKSEAADETVFKIYKGENLLATLSIHHKNFIRWRDGKWNGDVEITEQSRKRLAEWLKEGGFAFPSE